MSTTKPILKPMSIINIEHDNKTSIKYIKSLIGENFTINNEPIEGHKYRYYRLYVNGNMNNYVALLFDDNGELQFCAFSKKCEVDRITHTDSIHEWGKIYLNDSNKTHFKAFLEYIYTLFSNNKRHLFSYVIEFNELLKRHLNSKPYRYYAEESKDGNLRLIDHDLALKLITSGKFNRIEHEGFTMLMLK